jgi:hypothetical protein
MRAVLALLMVLAAPGWCADWLPFKDPDGRFTIDLPGTPNVKDDTTKNPTDGSAVGLHEYIIDRGDIAFIVIVSDLTRYPDADPAKVLDGAVEGGKKGNRALSDSFLTLEGRIGRAVVMLDKDDNRIDNHVFFARGVLFQVMVASSPKASDGMLADGRRFQDSFHFTN